MAKSTKVTQSASEKSIPRPLNCFLLYRLDKQKEIVGKCSGANHRDISKIIAKWWKKASEEEKKPYRERARIAKIEHNKLYPNYKYTPKKKATPKRVYIRRNKKDKFTSRAKENNELMEMIYEDPSALDAIAEVKNVRESSPSNCDTLKKACKVNKSIVENTVVVAETVYEEVDDAHFDGDEEEEYSFSERPSCRYANSVSSYGTEPNLKFDSQMASPLTDSYSEPDMSSPFTEQSSFNFGMSYTPPLIEAEFESHYQVLDSPFINETNAFSFVPLEEQLHYFQLEQAVSVESEKYVSELSWSEFPYMFTEAYQNSFMQHHQSVKYINPAMLHTI